MKRVAISLILIGFLIPGNILECCPKITGWEINPDPPFVNEDVKVSCTIEPQSDQTITSWEMTIREDGVIKGTPNTGSGGAQGQSVVASSNTVQFENPGQKNAEVTGKYLEKDDPDFSGDKDFNVYKVVIGDVARGAGPNSLPPTKTSAVFVSIIPSFAGAPHDICFHVSNRDANNGMATISTESFKRTDSGAITVLGGSTQTNPGYAGNLKIVAKLNGVKQCAISNGFSVCAHPSAITNTLLATNLVYGLRVNIAITSDTGVIDDLNKCEFTELITYSAISNPPFGSNGGSPLPESGTTQRLPTTPYVCNAQGLYDTHKHPSSLVCTPPSTGSYTVTQKYQFKCLRCGSVWTDIFSGYYGITYSIYNSKPTPVIGLRFKTKKEGTGGPFESDEDIPNY
ncbi:MAG: hypothetical protein ABH873_01685 [Candidatus Firestonebacteria bacterium]